MKKLSIILIAGLLAAASIVSVSAQTVTNSDSAIQSAQAGFEQSQQTVGLFEHWFEANSDFLSASNYLAYPYGDFDGNGNFGAGLFVGYKVNPHVIGGFGIDWFSGDLTMPSGNLTVKQDFALSQSIAIAPYVVAAAAVPISGGHSSNGSPAGIFGTGAMLSVNHGWLKANIGGQFAYWSNTGSHDGVRYYVVTVFSF